MFCFHQEKENSYFTKTSQVPNLLRCVGQEKLLQAYVVDVERKRSEIMRVGMKKNGGVYIDATTSILDMEGMNAGLTVKEARDYVGALAKLNSTCYPESMGKLFIINAPLIFTMSWYIVKAMLDERTVSKVHSEGTLSLALSDFYSILLHDYYVNRISLFKTLYAAL